MAEVLTKRAVNGIISSLVKAANLTGTGGSKRQQIHLAERKGKEMSYSKRQEQRKQALENKAATLEKESSNLIADSLSLLPESGQPLLIGHHSEKKHRKALTRSHSMMDRSLEISKKAKQYKEKAAAVGTGGISAYDEDAITKLKTQLKGAETWQEKYKKANKLFRQKKHEELKNLLGESAEHLINTNTLPAQSFELTNNLARIKRLKKRITELTSIKGEKRSKIDYGWFTVITDPESMRIEYHFESKPDEETRKKIKYYGFKFSRYSLAWVRKYTLNAKQASKSLTEALKKDNEE